VTRTALLFFFSFNISTGPSFLRTVLENAAATDASCVAAVVPTTLQLLCAGVIITEEATVAVVGSVGFP